MNLPVVSLYTVSQHRENALNVYHYCEASEFLTAMAKIYKHIVDSQDMNSRGPPTLVLVRVIPFAKEVMSEE